VLGMFCKKEGLAFGQPFVFAEKIGCGERI
jgi:hypothetical protein